jgi:signal transduction histidine kinase
VSSTFAWIVFALFFLYLYEFPARIAIPAVVVLAAIVVTVLLVRENGNPAATVIGPLLGAAVAIVIMRIYHDLLSENGERRRAVEALEAAQADLLATHDELARLQRATGVLQERERLAREIHDTLAQGFSSILLTARAARAEPGADPRLARIEALAGENLEETRRVVAALTPADLDQALLIEALARLVDRFETQTAVTATLDSDGPSEALPTQYEAALLRVAQSALANVREHAAAHRVAITLSYLPDAVTLDVVDDGCGFDPGLLVAPSGPTATSGFGLRGMSRRVAELGGRLTVESAPREGTAVAAALPLPAQRSS